MVTVYKLCVCGRLCHETPCERCRASLPRRRRQWRLERRDNRSSRDNRPSRHKRGYDNDWLRLRARIIAEQPLCARCLEHGLCRPAEEVHHIVPIKVDPQLRLEISNLLPVCRRCHRILERHAKTKKTIVNSTT
jgi:5-methylcytosine-specific restriction endonuclease McrA